MRANTFDTRCRSARTRRGGVLIATLMMVLAVGGLSVCLLEIDSTRLKRQVASVDNKRAFNLAEAGLSEACFGVATGKTGAVGTTEEPAKFGDGLFWVTSSDLGDGLIGLESTGMAGSGRVTLSLVVQRLPDSVATLGVLGAQQVSLGSRAQIDAYDSRDQSGGLPLPPLLGPTAVAQLRSNGNIVLGMSAKVVGDATPGPQGSVSLGLLASVSGSTAPASEPVELPEIEVPEIPCSPDIAHSGSQPLILSAPEVAYGSLQVKSGAKVTIKGPSTMVVGKLVVESNGELTFDESQGPIELYVVDWLALKSGSKLKFPQQDPLGLTLNVSATGDRDRNGDGVIDAPVTFQPTGPFYGMLYAPGARLSLPTTYELFGSVSAAQLGLGDRSKVHFDEALLASESSASGQVEVLSWRIVEIPVEIAHDLGADPFETLAVDPDTLPEPADAHADANFDIDVKYLDLLLTRKRYNGPESGFNWGLVKIVLSLSRRSTSN